MVFSLFSHLPGLAKWLRPFQAFEILPQIALGLAFTFLPEAPSPPLWLTIGDSFGRMVASVFPVPPRGQQPIQRYAGADFFGGGTNDPFILSLEQAPPPLINPHF